jgi:HK97 family phage portal protein
MGLIDLAKRVGDAHGIQVYQPQQVSRYEEYTLESPYGRVGVEKSQTWRLIDEALKAFETVPTDGDYAAFLRTYAILPWIYIATYQIATSLAKLPIEIVEGEGKDEKVIEVGSVNELFRRPNQFDSMQDFIELTVINAELTGNWYWEKFGVIGKLPSALYNISPNNMEIIPHPKTKIGAYRFWLFNKIDHYDYAPDEIIHGRYPNPASEFYGQGTVKALQTTLVTELNREAYNKAFFENEARPDIILTHSPDASKGIAPLTKDDREELAIKWRESFLGPRKARKPVVLRSGMDAKLLTETSQDMGYREMEKSHRERVLGGMGVPPALVGLFEFANYANTKEQLKIFYLGTLPPKANKIANALTYGVLKPYDKGLKCRFNFNDITLLQEDNKERTDRLNSLFDRGLITPDEYRQMLGWEPSGGKHAKVFFMSSSYVPVDDVLAPPPEENPEQNNDKKEDEENA